jgi:hypothetical protein
MVVNHELVEEENKVWNQRQEDTKRGKCHTQSVSSYDAGPQSKIEFDSDSRTERTEGEVMANERKAQIVEAQHNKQMLLERKQRYQHIICTIVNDKSTGKY